MTAPQSFSPAQKARWNELENLAGGMTEQQLAELMFLQMLAGDLEIVDQPRYRLTEQGKRKAEQIIYGSGGPS